MPVRNLVGAFGGARGGSGDMTSAANMAAFNEGRLVGSARLPAMLASAEEPSFILILQIAVVGLIPGTRLRPFV